eukprot:1154210-Pelagomonas_calceolata.AAC.2
MSNFSVTKVQVNPVYGCPAYLAHHILPTILTVFDLGKKAKHCNAPLNTVKNPLPQVCPYGREPGFASNLHCPCSRQALLAVCTRHLLAACAAHIHTRHVGRICCCCCLCRVPRAKVCKHGHFCLDHA